MPLALENLDVSLGLAIIPVQFFTATTRKASPSTCSTRGAGLGSRCVWSTPPRHHAPRRDGERVRDRQKRVRALRAEELEALEQTSSSALVMGWALVRSDEANQGLPHLERGAVLQENSGDQGRSAPSSGLDGRRVSSWVAIF
jgi:hypothetical protein